VVSRWAALALVLATSTTGCVVRSVNQPAGACVEPQPLCGEWAGAWDSNGNRREAYLTVRRVAGREVEGLALIRGAVSYHDMDLPFTGTFDGKDLVGAIDTGPGRPTVTWRLQLDSRGAELKGRGFSDGWADLYLVKRR
jgi:hypothetical protein